MKKKIGILSCLCIILLLTGCSSATDARRFARLLSGNAIIKNYEGPILSLSALTDTKGIQAERTVNYDFSTYADTSNEEERKIIIRDDYTLTNTTNGDITIKAVYGFAETLEDAKELIPTISLNGQNVDTTFTLGRDTYRYAMLHESMGEENAYDLDSLLNVESYKRLLEDGEYMREAFEDVPEMSQHVYVYKLANLGYSGDNEKIKLPSAEVKYNADYKKSVVFKCGDSGWSHPDEVTEALYFNIPVKGDEDFKRKVMR